MDERNNENYFTKKQKNVPGMCKVRDISGKKEETCCKKQIVYIIRSEENKRVEINNEGKKYL